MHLCHLHRPAVAIAGVAVNGGTDNAAYDYTGLDYPPGSLTTRLGRR